MPLESSQRIGEQGGAPKRAGCSHEAISSRQSARPGIEIDIP